MPTWCVASWVWRRINFLAKWLINVKVDHVIRVICSHTNVSCSKWHMFWQVDRVLFLAMATNQAWVCGVVRQGSTLVVASTILAATDHDTYVYTYHPATRITPSSCPICETEHQVASCPICETEHQVCMALQRSEYSTQPSPTPGPQSDGIPTYMYVSNRLTVTIAICKVSTMVYVKWQSTWATHVSRLKPRV